MLSHDVYITHLRATILSLETWLAQFQSVTSAEIDSDEASWRAAVTPHVVGACPFELMLRIDQRYDLAIGRETYEDQPIETLDQFLPMLMAVANGHVIVRSWETLATGTLVKIETVVAMPGAPPWIGVRQLAFATAPEPWALVKRDRHFSPYLRQATAA